MRILKLIEDDGRWEFLQLVLDALAPAYTLLRMVDGYKPAAGKVYHRLLLVDEHYQTLKSGNPGVKWCEQLLQLQFWADDWNYMHVDFHSLGFCVDPENHGRLGNMGQTVWAEFVRFAKRMLKAAPASRGFTIEQLTDEYSQYQNLEGGFTTDVLDMAKGTAGHKWWQQWGKSTPALQYVSQRALAQTVSASCSGQACSEYDFVHSQRRNILEKDGSKR